MKARFRRPRVRRFATGLFLLLTPTACYSWRTSALPLPEERTSSGTDYRLTLADGRQVKVVDPRLVSDSVIATLAERQGVRFAALGTQVVRVERHHFEAGNTIMLGVGLIAIPLVVMAVLLEEADMCCGSSP